MYKAIRLVYTEKEHVENHLYSHRKEKIKNQNANIISLRSRAPGLVTHFWSLNSLMPRLDRVERRQLGRWCQQVNPTAKLPVEDPHLQSHTGPPTAQPSPVRCRDVDPVSWKTFEKTPALRVSCWGVPRGNLLPGVASPTCDCFLCLVV